MYSLQGNSSQAGGMEQVLTGTTAVVTTQPAAVVLVLKVLVGVVPVRDFHPLPPAIFLLLFILPHLFLCFLLVYLGMVSAPHGMSPPAAAE